MNTILHNIWKNKRAMGSMDFWLNDKSTPPPGGGQVEGGLNVRVCATASSSNSANAYLKVHQNITIYPWPY